MSVINFEKFFTPNNPNWNDDIQTNEMFFRMAENMLGEKACTKGFVTLLDAFETLGFNPDKKLARYVWNYKKGMKMFSFEEVEGYDLEGGPLSVFKIYFEGLEDITKNELEDYWEKISRVTYYLNDLYETCNVLSPKDVSEILRRNGLVIFDKEKSKWSM